jgi:glutamyl-Q tRNA(Asp) synthetase
MSIITRFAPSPTGLLHLGHAFSAWANWRRGGVFLVRLEDIDRTRCRAEFAGAILEDLRWLGLHWHGAMRVQSAHLGEYRAALETLEARGLVYPCFCTRREIAQAQSAPHGAGAVYPGTCRGMSAAERAERRAAGAAYALRLDGEGARRQAGGLRFFEERQGWVTARPELLGDVVLARKEVPTSYHLCVVHDDALQGVSHVIRGEDLAAAAHVQVLLQRLLGYPTPVYAHHRLLTDAQGRRLAKREGSENLRGLRESGMLPGRILAQFEDET